MGPIKKISKRTQRGIIVTLILLSVIILFPRIYMHLLPNKTFTIEETALNEAAKKIKHDSETARQKKYSQARKNRYSKPPSRFNPNNYTKSDWMKLGLTSKQAQVVLNFMKRGIYSNQQLQQIFVIDEALFELIKDSTFYPQKQRNKYEFKQKQAPRLTAQIELNSATFDELIKLPGIGDFYAELIIDYRKKLGGYFAKNQLLELWKFNQEKLDRIEKHIHIDQTKIRKININSCNTETLSKHPYIEWNVANSIVKMRAQNGNYTNFEQLLRSKIIDEELLTKCRPYLSLK